VPKYAYGCSSCGKEWEEWKLMSESSLLVCPHCEEGPPHKLPPGTLFQKDKRAQGGNDPTGKLVEDAIVEAKEEFKRHKREYKEKDDDYF